MNGILRQRIPLETVYPHLNLSEAKTCKTLHEVKAPYLKEIYITPRTRVSPRDFKFSFLVKQALEKADKSTQETYRGMRSCGAVTDSKGQIKKFFLEKGFMSTTTRREVAERFTRNENSLEDDSSPKGCLLKIKGLSGVAIAAATGNYNNEDEVLFPPGNLFEIKSVQSNGDQKIVEMTEVPNSEFSEKIKAEIYLQDLVTSLRLYEAESLAPLALKAQALLSADAESACKEAYKFFTDSPEIRSKLDSSQPFYNLKDKKMNPEDFAAEE